ncbi:carboxymuconolactone decarboxylase family protein [candidate division WOR-3 bacterium]|uniref:Carboxymuconolactone decarboxylase family protein n=1 Tax=candidate division WOR-3 bacterium TaxID=2052148 RepID=A0A660SMD7_UNCW3|nr:MAG: carboxymuconolactone decarboxylase family protein [candidate division WOR-3 bacterium]
MARIKQINPEEASSYTRKLFKRIKEAFGTIPNMFRCMGNSEMALDGFLSMNASLGAGKLGPKNMKLVILATSQLNDCEYCASAHTQMAKDAGLLTDEECLNARKLIGSDPKSDALLKFTGRVFETRGKVTDQDLEAIRQAGFSDEEIIEILATMALITFANYTSNVGEPDLDFPKAPEV